MLLREPKAAIHQSGCTRLLLHASEDQPDGPKLATDTLWHVPNAK